MQVVLIGLALRLFALPNFQWLAYTARALKRLGHRTTVVPFRESWLASPLLSRQLKGMPTVSAALQRWQQAQRRRQDRGLIRLVRRLRPDLLLVLNGDVLSYEVLAQIKRLARGPMVTWWYDDPWRTPAFLPRFRLFDRVFIFDRFYLGRLIQMGLPRVHFLPAACDETVYRPLPLSAAQRQRWECDIAFVAWYYPERLPIVQALAADARVGVWGGGWWETSEIRRSFGDRGLVRGGAVSDRTAARIYSACKIGLNVHQVQSRVGGLNMRTFELLGSGVAPLVDYVEGMEELLDPETEVACYRSPEEARRLARHYLNDAGERMRLAARGRARVLAEHTYVARLRTLCEVARC